MTNTDHPQDGNVLENIFKCPAMFWGNSDNHFHSFVAFPSGYQTARSDMLGEEARAQLDQIIPPRFHKFVTEYYGHKFPHGGYGWTSFIEENTSSDREALDLFIKLKRLYDEQPKAEQDGGGEPANRPESK